MVYVPPVFIPEYRPVRKFALTSSAGWWLNRWPLLGWLETFVKIAAWLFVPFIPRPGPYPIPPERMTPVFAVETAVMLLASVILATAVIDRLVYREIISMIFVFPNNWAHWTVALAMLRGGRAGVNIKYLRIFCWLMLAGDVIKLVFFAWHDFTRLEVARFVIYSLVAIFAVFYAVILVLDYENFPQIATMLYEKLNLREWFKNKP